MEWDCSAVVELLLLVLILQVFLPKQLSYWFSCSSLLHLALLWLTKSLSSRRTSFLQQPKQQKLPVKLLQATGGLNQKLLNKEL